MLALDGGSKICFDNFINALVVDSLFFAFIEKLQSVVQDLRHWSSSTQPIELKTSYMRSTFIASLLIVASTCLSCSDEREGMDMDNTSDTTAQSSEHSSTTTPFVAKIKNAHKAPEFFAQKAVAFDIKLAFAGKPRLTGTITMMTNSTKVLVEKENGDRVLYDGSDVLLYPADADWPRARFDVLTWSWFFAAPYKLDDPGTHWTSLGRLPFDETDSAEAEQLTFGDGIGDAPDDWYIVYRDEATSLMKGTAYVVTYGKSAEEQSKAEPHALTYHNYKEFAGILFATRWLFRDWSKEAGVSGQRGEASISNVRFIDNPETTFQLPADAKNVPLAREES